MGSGASTKKVQLLNDAIRKTEEEFDEETKLIFEKMPPKGFVKKDGRHGFLSPFVTVNIFTLYLYSPTHYFTRPIKLLFTLT